ETLLQDGVRFAQILEERERVVALLRRATADGSYRPAPASLTRAQIGGKEREIARIGALDLVVHAVIAEILAERVEPLLSPHLYSYRRGRSPWQALRVLARVAGSHCAARPDPRTRGLYVLRSDIKSYTDSIPLGDDALLWRDLRAALGCEPGDPRFAMVRALLRPPLARGEGEPPAPRDRGLLFGAPTTNVAGNVYLMELDEALGGRPGAYARFGDDVLFAHAEPDPVRDAQALLEAILARRGVEPNRKKLRVLYWNGAARPSPRWPEAQAVRDLPFLGAVTRFDGTIGLAPAKWTSLLRELRARIEHTARLLDGDRPKERAKILAAVVNDAFDVRSELSVREASLAIDLVSDRSQLAQLDYWVARWIAEAATGKHGPRAFRTVPWWWLRRSAKLASRVVARNG
ncbi:MAG TPA: hypothetical protein VLT33_19305, partial [Labilithrix sp.]|nr:hypothetical protein [Labilithrix sp.]